MKMSEPPANPRTDPDWLRKHPRYRHSHQWLDRCNLAMARRIAEKIREKPELMEIPRRVLRRWKRLHRPWPPALREWEKILAKYTTERILEILTQDNDEGQRLRQSDPFVGILTEKERMWFLEDYEEDAIGTRSESR
jgi:hypothetical protein